MSCSLNFLKKGSSLSWCVAFALFLTSLHAEVNYNKVILEAMDSIPHDGGYSTSSVAMQNLQRAVTLSQGELQIKPGTPSFCSEATYFVFLKTLLLLQKRGELALNPATLIALLPRGQADGIGIWGRWNANGPGTACLFYEMALGKNFTDLQQAEPGDFCKIFWTTSIGATEHGHLVIYLGHEMRSGVEMMHFWSSNQHVGYSDKWVPLRAMKRLIFSRLTNPFALNASASLSRCNPYLASLLSKSTSWEEVKQRCEIKE